MKSRAAILCLLAGIAVVPFLPSLVRGEILSYRDHADYFAPLRYFTAEHLRRGELPLWNPYNGSGERWLANPQTAIFYPPAWMFVLVPFQIAYPLFLAFHIAVLGCGAFLLLRQWCSVQASLLAAIVAMLCGPTLSLLDVSNNLATLSWYPLAFWAAGRRSEEIPAFPRGVDALILAAMFLGGEPYLAMIGLVIYSVISVCSTRGRGLPGLAAVIALFLMLIAVQLLPFGELLAESDRIRGLAPELAFRESMAPSDWLTTALAPYASHGPRLHLSQHFIPSMYMTIPVIVFALVAIFRFPRRGKTGRLPVAALGLCLLMTVLIASGGVWLPLQKVWAAMGLDLVRYPSRVAPLGGLALAGLAAIGFDQISRAALWIRVLAVLACAGMIHLAFIPAQAERSGLLFSLTILAAIAVVIVGFPAVLEKRVIFAVLALAITTELLLASTPFFVSTRFSSSIAPYETLLRSDRKTIRLISQQSMLRPLEVFDRRAWLGGYLNLFIHRFDASTPAPVVSAAYLKLHDVALLTPRFDLVDFLSIGYLLSERSIQADGYEQIANARSVKVYRNQNAFPAAMGWSGWLPVSSDSEALERLLAKSSDARKTLYVRGAPHSGPQLIASSEGPVPMSLKRISLNQVEMTSDAPGSTIVTLSQLQAPGWRVEIDGRGAKSLTANGMFQAVHVPAGAHRIVWRYRPHSFLVGSLISLAGFAWVSIDLVLFRRKYFSRAARSIEGKSQDMNRV